MKSLNFHRKRQLFPDNGINQEKKDYQLVKRIRLPTGRTTAQIYKKHEIVSDDNDDVDGDDANGDDELTDQLDDTELAILARIVQNHLDLYNPDLSVDEYQIVKLPRSSIKQPILSYTEDIGGNENELTMLTDDQPKITRPVIKLPEDEIYETNEETDEISKYVLIPTEEMNTVPTAMIENDLAPVDDALDDLELRSRIASIANALNERAARGL
ncbi:unnamed protein product [Acanthocheilonema viteae]|uniref:Uncharacterized protein n=1 Tax=Acanthocheilonema viteae TaxID=6277 RepID=A0A498S6A7_ACAVI|nr:unnamed protein product [Acanthocheilonema viteae]